MNISDAIKFVREKNLLTSWSDEQIALDLSKAIRDCCFGFEVVGETLASICWGRWIKDDTVHITVLIGKYRTYIEYLRKIFPGIKFIEMERGNRTIIFKVK